MTETKPNDKNKCGRRKGAMLAFGLVQLGTGIVSALSLAVIAISFCAVKQEANVFTNCVDEVTRSGKSKYAAVHYCNGGT